jgi:hypothetical protein
VDRSGRRSGPGYDMSHVSGSEYSRAKGGMPDFMRHIAVKSVPYRITISAAGFASPSRRLRVHSFLWLSLHARNASPNSFSPSTRHS